MPISIANPSTVPPAIVSPVILAPQVEQKPVTPAAHSNMLQGLQPLPPKALPSTTSTNTPSAPLAHALQVSSQISQDTANADAEISQLIETMQKNPESLSIETEKMADFIKSIQSENEASSVDPGGESLGSPKPIPVTIPSSSANSNQPVSKPELTSGTTGFQASFLNSLASRRFSAEEDPLQSPTQPNQPETLNNVPSQLISQVVPTTAPASTSSSMVSMGGGASSQMRALQNLPQNTRFVRGPNGQYTLQKVQTIELTPEMQQVR